MPVVDWPQTLVDRIAANHWVLFIGSGVSASCQNRAGDRPPDWRTLLTKLCAMISDADSRDLGLRLVEGREYLAAADHIRYVLDVASDVASYYQAIKEAVEGPTGDKFQPSSLFDRLIDLDPKIVVTTNYDKLFEAASGPGFAVHPVTSTLLSHDLRLGEPVLVKVHGSTDAIVDVVLSRADYARLAKAGRDVFDALAALSLTFTILFVGYSLDDPDIQLVLQAVGQSGMSPEAHFMLAPEPESRSQIAVFRNCYGVSVLTYPAGQHAEAEKALADLCDRVLSARSPKALSAT
jgi:hypothetical protein